jgi:putative ABC transport system permease protein
MISSRWHKVLNDLWGNKTRTVLIVLSIAVGLFAVGTIVTSRTILSAELARSYAAINPSSGTIRTVEPFDEGFVRSVRRMDEVKDADARRILYAQILVGPDEWTNLTIFVVSDFDDIRVNKIWPEDGAWPPPEREILIERAALPIINAQVGDVALIETPDEKQRQLRIAGAVHDLAQLPAQIDGDAYGYVSFETLEWFGEPYGFNEIHIIPENSESKEQVQRAVNQVKSKAERSGFTIPMSLTAEPGQLPTGDILDALLLLMGALGLLSLILSVFLIVNTVSALLAQQKRQIGIMKALGARTSQIMGMFMVMVLSYGLMALIIAVPLGAIGSQALSRFMALMFNFDLTHYTMPPEAIIFQIVVGLAVPVLASLYPFLTNLRVTAAEAMSTYTMGRGRFGTGPLDRLLSGANLWFARQFLMRSLLLSLRNTFRSKGRLALTLITLTLGGAMFISVFSVNSSLTQTIDDLMGLYNFDSIIHFTRRYRAERIQQEASSVPGVAQIDYWLMTSGRRVRPDGSEGETIYMFAPRADSELVPGPGIVEGRWLLPDDENALVIDSTIHDEEPDINLGDDIVLKVEGRKTTFRVVGFSMGLMIPVAYAHYPYIARATDNVGLADNALVATERHDEASIAQITQDLRAQLERNGMGVSLIASMATERAEAEAIFAAIVGLLMVMAVLLAVVGGLGLMGTMSINVLERTREIGVLRAIGAPNRGVAQVFILEGVMIGVLSWLLGTLLALPLSKLLSDGVGIPIMGAPLSFSFSMTGVLVWLIVVIILSAIASFVPARNASQLTVRETLAYE